MVWFAKATGTHLTMDMGMTYMAIDMGIKGPHTPGISNRYAGQARGVTNVRVWGGRWALRVGDCGFEGSRV